MILMFADDMKISRRVSDEQDGLLLQQDPDYQMEWSKLWHLDFNIEKCKVMRICHQKRTNTN